MNSDIAYQIAIGFLFVAFISSVVYIRILLIERNEPPSLPAVTDHDLEPITQQLPVGAVSQITVNSALSMAFRENLIVQKDDKLTIFQLRALVDDKNATIILQDEQIHIQSDLLVEQARTMTWDKNLIILQEGKIRIFEVKAAALLNDGLEPRPYVVGMDRGTKL